MALPLPKRKKLKTKMFNDPVHGHVDMHPLCVRVIDTAQFQRLRKLKQLGTCYYVFGGAAHNRFEHSLGVSYLAGEWVEHFRRMQPELGVTDEDVICVKLAGLIHDLGHGPFSHAFEHFLEMAADREEEVVSGGCGGQMPRRPIPDHEHLSAYLFDHLIEENGLMPYFAHYGLGEGHIHMVKEMVFGGKKKAPADWEWRGPPLGKEFLFQIVANKENGIDVDKFDYFMRDGRHLNISISFDVERLMKCSKVLPVVDDVEGEGGDDSAAAAAAAAADDDDEEEAKEGKGGGKATSSSSSSSSSSSPAPSSSPASSTGQLAEPRYICFHEKETWNLYELFHTRYSLHKRAYQHRVVSSVEEMMNELLMSADAHFRIPYTCRKTGEAKSCRISEAPFVLEAYSKLTDTIVDAVLLSPDPNFDDARRIMRRIDTRDLHMYVNESIYDSSKLRKGKRIERADAAQLSEKIADEAAVDPATGRPTFSAGDIFAKLITINYGKKGVNPIDDCTYFFGRSDQEFGQKIQQSRVSSVLPTNFEEQTVRCYTKKNELKDEVDKAFAKWCEKVSQREGLLASPAPPGGFGGGGGYPPAAGGAGLGGSSATSSGCGGLGGAGAATTPLPAAATAAAMIAGRSSGSSSGSSSNGGQGGQNGTGGVGGMGGMVDRMDGIGGSQPQSLTQALKFSSPARDQTRRNRTSGGYRSSSNGSSRASSSSSSSGGGGGGGTGESSNGAAVAAGAAAAAVATAPAKAAAAAAAAAAKAAVLSPGRSPARSSGRRGSPGAEDATMSPVRIGAGGGARKRRRSAERPGKGE